MEKRIFIAVILSVVFLWIWSAIVPAPNPVASPEEERSAETKEAGTRKTEPKDPSGAASPLETATSSTVSSSEISKPVEQPRFEPTAANVENETVVETALYTARFSNRGANLVSFRLKEYGNESGDRVDLVRRNGVAPYRFPFAIQSGDAAFDRRVNGELYEVRESEQGGTRTVEFRYVGPDHVQVTKSFSLGASYQFVFDVSVKGRDLPYRVVVGPGIRVLDAEEKDTQFVRLGDAVLQRDGKLEVVHRDKTKGMLEYSPRPSYIGLEDNYFLAVLQPKVGGSGVVRSIELGSNEDGKPRPELFAGVNAAAGSVSGHAFFGPKKVDIVRKFGLENTLQFGFFGWIAHFLLKALVWINTTTKNFGWSIIVLTIIIKVLLYPLQHKSIVSMKRMQRVQPKVAAIKEKYKKARSDADQRQKMNTEMMKLYQVEGINPASGCLPILLQLPILWAFYSLLGRAIELRGAEFILWIHDLSAKDPYYITPVLMTITMYIQQKMTPMSVDPIQKKMFLAMPFVFGWIFKEFPAGLVLYWLVQNILSILQQYIMNRWWKEHPTE